MYRTPFIAFIVVTAGIATWAHWPHPPLPEGVVAGGGELLRTYPIALGADPIGPKSRQGDGCAPEGRYRIDYRKEDTPGGLIMVHGLPNDGGWLGRLHRAPDWTNGCIAVTERRDRGTVARRAERHADRDPAVITAT